MSMTSTLCEKCPNTEFFSGPYFPVFGRKNSACAHFLRSGKH